MQKINGNYFLDELAMLKVYKECFIVNWDLSVSKLQNTKLGVGILFGFRYTDTYPCITDV